MTKIVTIGGGTGTHTVLSGLKKYPLDLTAIVTTADSGGSTGRLRDDFGVLPVGDVRMALTALASSEEDAEILRELFLYRFDKGESGLKGHNFGNLFLVAMANVLGSYEKGVKYAGRILRIKGNILPITSKPVDLHAEYEDGEIVKGEAIIDDASKNGRDGKKKIKKLWIEPETPVSSEAAFAIMNADFIVLGPGDLYTSIFPNLVVPGVEAAFKKSKAYIIYVPNLMTKYGQTFGFTAKDHVETLREYLGKYPDSVILNNANLPADILKKYKEENDFPVSDDLTGYLPYKVARANILVPEEIEKSSGDVVKRSLLRHDPDKLAWEIVKITKEVELNS